MKEKIAVLMSTYNGEQYIKDQLDSILKQSDVSLDLWIRDDGSNDKTISIIKGYQINNSNIHLIRGNNIGVAQSFLTLIYEVDGYDYYALSDQDDVWLNNKLSAGIEYLKKSTCPMLYFSAKKIVDSSLNSCHDVFDNYVRTIDIGTALMQNCASGCTMIFNKMLRDIISMRKVKLENKRFLHDWWIYDLGIIFGKVVYDKKAYILYRQHKKNVAGGESGFFNRWKRRIRLIKDRKSNLYRSYAAKMLLDEYGDYIPVLKKNKIYNIAYLRKDVWLRLVVFFSREYKTNKRTDIIFLKMFILLGWF